MKDLVGAGCRECWTSGFSLCYFHCSVSWVMAPRWKCVLSSVLCLSLPCLVLLQQCTDSCKACGGPENNTCLACKDGWDLHDRHCVGECRFSEFLSGEYSALETVWSLWCSSLADVNECDVNLANCPSSTYCVNTEGSYECRGERAL